ncbi:MAG: hypothetical protein EXQ85_01200 [Alphaproteobacteria bacterium]|nr:hypothetical protein [Alphaproteobacteria bacterium]
MTEPERASVGQRLRALRLRAGFSMNALSKAIGYRGVAGYQRYESPEFTKEFIPVGLVHRMLGGVVGRGSPPVTPTEVLALAGLSHLGAPSEPVFDVPIVSWRHAVNLVDRIDPAILGAAQERLMAPYSRDSLVALRMHDHAMNRIAPRGALILVDYEARHLDHGRYYVFRHRGEALCRRYFTAPDRFEPDTYLPGFEALFPPPPIDALGRVVRVIINDP